MTRHSRRFLPERHPAHGGGTDHETPVTVASAISIPVSRGSVVGRATKLAPSVIVNGALPARIAATATAVRAETTRNDGDAPQRITNSKGSRHAPSTEASGHVGTRDVGPGFDNGQSNRGPAGSPSPTGGAGMPAANIRGGAVPVGAQRETVTFDRPFRVGGGIA